MLSWTWLGSTGLAVQVGIDVQLRRHARLEHRDLEREIAIAQQTAVVRTTLEIGRRGAGLAGGCGGRLRFGHAGGKRDRREQN